MVETSNSWGVKKQMRFTVEDLADYEEKVLRKYPILKNYNPIIDYPYKNEKIGRLTIEIDDLDALVDLQNELEEEIILRNDYEIGVYNDAKDCLPMLEINNS